MSHSHPPPPGPLLLLPPTGQPLGTVGGLILSAVRAGPCFLGEQVEAELESRALWGWRLAEAPTLGSGLPQHLLTSAGSALLHIFPACDFFLKDLFVVI